MIYISHYLRHLGEAVLKNQRLTSHRSPKFTKINQQTGEVRLVRSLSGKWDSADRRVFRNPVRHEVTVPDEAMEVGMEVGPDHRSSGSTSRRPVRLPACSGSCGKTLADSDRRAGQAWPGVFDRIENRATESDLFLVTGRAEVPSLTREGEKNLLRVAIAARLAAGPPLPPEIAAQTEQPRAQQQYGGRFRCGHEIVGAPVPTVVRH